MYFKDKLIYVSTQFYCYKKINDSKVIMEFIVHNIITTIVIRICNSNVRSCRLYNLTVFY